MASIELDEVLGRLRRLNNLVTAYGYVLIASELDRPLPAVIPLLVSDNLSESEAGGLVKEILGRGGAALVADLEEVERLIRQGKKDPQISAALRGVRLTFQHTARLHAGALARKMERAVQLGAAVGPEAPSLQRELEAFISGVAHAVREDDVEFEEVFADEDLVTDGEAPEPSGSALYKEGPESPEGDLADAASGPTGEEDLGVERVPEMFSSSWNINASERETEAEQETEGGADERSLDWLRDHVDVYNEMLARWGAGEAFIPESSPLVRRGLLTPERCAEVYRDLLAEGATRLADRLHELGTAPGGIDDRLRHLRSRIADGLATGVPRILALLVSGEVLPADLADSPGGSRDALADLTVYLTRGVDLFDEASPQRSRLSYLASELRLTLKQTSA